MSEHSPAPEAPVGETQPKRGVLVAIALLLGLLALTSLAPTFVRDAVFPQAKVTVDRGYYYRVTAKYEYLGAPVDFNIVVGCSVEVTDSKLTGKSYMTGIAPAVYGLKMPNGKGLVMRVPEACRGEKTWDEAKGQYPPQKSAFILSPRFRPFMAVYDDADKPMFGWGYASDDAYESPLSELKFISVRIDAATRDEFIAWRTSDAHQNIIRTDIISWDVVTHKNWANVRPGYWIFGDTCKGVRLHRMSTAVADAVKPFWPSTRPEYWVPEINGSRAFEKSRSFGEELIEAKKYPVTLPGSSGEHGMLRTNGGSFVVALEAGLPLLAGDIYPVKSEFTTNSIYKSGPSVETGVVEYYDSVILDQHRKGFVFCDGPSGSLVVKTSDPRGARRVWRVNDTPIVNLNDPPMPLDGSNWWFRRDEWFFIPIGFGFHAPLGGL